MDKDHEPEGRIMVTGDDRGPAHAHAANPDAIESFRGSSAFTTFAAQVLFDFHNMEDSKLGICGSGGKYCSADMVGIIKAAPYLPPEVRGLIDDRLRTLQREWDGAMRELAKEVKELTGAKGPAEIAWTYDGTGGPYVVVAHKRGTRGNGHGDRTR